MTSDPVRTFLARLRRRKVVRVAAVYAVVAWALIQVADVVIPRLALPDWTITFIVVLALFGFPVAVVLAWAFEVTPEGSAVGPDGVNSTEADLFELARMAAVRGDADGAASHLRAAVEAGFSGPELIELHPTFDAVREDARIRAPVAEMHTELDRMRDRVRREGW